MRRFIIIIVLILVSLFLYGHYIEINKIKINEYVLNSEGVPQNIKKLKIVHFSDILYKPNDDTKILEKLVENINATEADIVIFSGDLFTKNVVYSDEDYNKIKNILKTIEANLYKFAITGDNDESYQEKYQDILYDANFTLLDNKNFLLFYKDITPINIIGINDMNKIEELLTTDVSYNYSLVISHKPDALDNLSKYNIQTILSGHSLGGIINIPYYGGMMKKDGAKKYINGKYSLNNTDLYISNGIGYEKFNFRLFNTPSINVYRFAQ